MERLIQGNSAEAFRECCQAFDGQSRTACEGFAQLKTLLERIKADDSKPLSVSTAQWCGDFAEGVLNRDSLARTKAEELLRTLHRGRMDMENVRQFCELVYRTCLARSEIRTDSDVLLLLCVAKAKDYDHVWPIYLSLAMKLDEDASIWKNGNETGISTIIVFTYDNLAGYSDDAVSQMSLADYCADDERFIDLQKRQKNAALRAILQKSPRYREKKRGLFGFLKH